MWILKDNNVLIIMKGSAREGRVSRGRAPLKAEGMSREETDVFARVGELGVILMIIS